MYKTAYTAVAACDAKVVVHLTALSVTTGFLMHMSVYMRCDSQAA